MHALMLVTSKEHGSDTCGTWQLLLL